MPRAWHRAGTQPMLVNSNGTELPAHILSHRARHFQGGRAGAMCSCRRLWKQPLDNLCCAPNPFWEPTEIPGLPNAKRVEGRFAGWEEPGWGTRKGNHLNTIASISLEFYALYSISTSTIFFSSLIGILGAKQDRFQYPHFSFSDE